MACEETRIGFAFNNPDLTNDRYYTDYGLLVTPDELRYIVTFGTRLVSTDANQTFTDDNLQYYIDSAIGMIEADLNIDLYPRVIRHEKPIDTITGERIERDDIDASQDVNLIYEPGYPFRQNMARHYLYTKLRRRPLQYIMKAVMVDPIMNGVIDLYKYRRETPGLQAKVQFFPHVAISGMANYPFMPTTLMTVHYPFKDFPSALLIDYKTGYERADKVPRDLIEVIRKVAGIMLLSDFGDGRTAAIANASISLNSISQAYGTTMSATSAMYGARIIQWQKDLQLWWKHNYKRYKRAVFGVL